MISGSYTHGIQLAKVENDCRHRLGPNRLRQRNRSRPSARRLRSDFGSGLAMQPHGVRRHLFSCREMSVNRRRSMPPPMTCGSETYRADRRRDPKRLTASLSGNLYKLRNRLLSGSYFPSPVRRVEIPKASGETRPLGIPTVADRIPGSRPALVLRRGGSVGVAKCPGPENFSSGSKACSIACRKSLAP